MNKLNEVVHRMLQKHTGGKEFFDNLDKSLQDELIVVHLFNLIQKHMEKDFVNLIVTGKFGRFFTNWLEFQGLLPFFCLYSVNGGLRNGNPIESLEYFKEDIQGKHFIVVDDSFYSGRTVDTIVDHVKSLGGNYKGAYVIYDGSKDKRSDVHSLYRYYESK